MPELAVERSWCTPSSTVGTVQYCSLTVLYIPIFLCRSRSDTASRQGKHATLVKVAFTIIQKSCERSHDATHIRVLIIPPINKMRVRRSKKRGRLLPPACVRGPQIGPTQCGRYALQSTVVEHENSELLLVNEFRHCLRCSRKGFSCTCTSLLCGVASLLIYSLVSVWGCDR